jgi:hypothetical protein
MNRENTIRILVDISKNGKRCAKIDFTGYGELSSVLEELLQNFKVEG